MIYPKIYNNFNYLLNKKTSKSIIIWLIILTIFLTIIISIIFNYKYYICQTYLGYIKSFDNSLYLTFYVPQDEVGELLNYKLLIDNQKIEFKILSISNDYYLIDNQPFYEIVIETDLHKKYLIENNIINLTFQKQITTLYQEIRKDFEL